jgi:hypothetical protein
VGADIRSNSFVEPLKAGGGLPAAVPVPCRSTLSDDRRDRIEALRRCSRERIV